MKIYIYCFEEIESEKAISSRKQPFSACDFPFHQIGPSFQKVITLARPRNKD